VWGGYCLARVYDTATTVCVKAFVIYVTLTVAVHNLLAVDVFGTGIFH